MPASPWRAKAVSKKGTLPVWLSSLQKGAPSKSLAHRRMTPRLPLRRIAPLKPGRTCSPAPPESQTNFFRDSLLERIFRSIYGYNDASKVFSYKRLDMASPSFHMPRKKPEPQTVRPDFPLHGAFIRMPSRSQKRRGPWLLFLSPPGSFLLFFSRGLLFSVA